MDDRDADIENRHVVVVYSRFSMADERGKHLEIHYDHNICDGKYAKKNHVIRQDFETLLDSRKIDIGRLAMTFGNSEEFQGISISDDQVRNPLEYYGELISHFRSLANERRRNNDGRYGMLDIRVRSSQAK